MRKLLAVILAFPIMILSKCGWVHEEHNIAAWQLQRRLAKVALPEGAQILEDKCDVGGFISGTGDAIDILAYRIFASELPQPLVHQVFASWIAETPMDDIRGIFRLDSSETSQSPVTEGFLRQAIPQTNAPTYVLYSAERIDDGVWDWRGL